MTTDTGKNEIEQVEADPAQAKARATNAIDPKINAAAVVATYSRQLGGGVDPIALLGALASGIDDLWAGDMKRPEAMLYAQAHALQSIFMTLSIRAATQEQLKNCDAYMRMAMKAQNQCRMTLETLATIKSPPVVFARQANINNGGQQQVNNGTQAEAQRAPARAEHAHAAKPETAQSELLEASDEQRLDTREAGAASGADPHMATVAAVNRPPNTGGQDPDGAQC